MSAMMYHNGPRSSTSQLNGNNNNGRRPPNFTRINSTERSMVHGQHDDLIKYISDSWSKIEMERSANGASYYEEDTSTQLKDFRPFDLDGFWGRRRQTSTGKH
ncbi:unnamed protein product [Phyllotreta striolata]|uniref:Uncharacterized protein n=1 Tax=Phyllotreta striolata TaxID=444603 RepID=A0A9N9TPR9_PHYSR|nr:unnamed protein product [Phyllotreta striolata]